MKLGLQNEYDAGRTGTAAALGALGGGVLGGAFGAVGGATVGRMQGIRDAEAEIAAERLMAEEEAARPAAEFAARQQEQDDLFPDAPRIEPEPSSEQEIDRVLNYRIEQLRAQLARARRDGEDTSAINKALTAARSLQIKRKTLDERMAAVEQQLASSDPAEIKRANKRYKRWKKSRLIYQASPSKISTRGQRSSV